MDFGTQICVWKFLYAELCLEGRCLGHNFQRHQMNKSDFQFFYFFFRFVKNLSSGREGWIPANNLLMLIGNSKSVQSLSSSGRLCILNKMIVSLKIRFLLSKKVMKNNHYIIFSCGFFLPFFSQNQALPPAI